MSVIATWPFFLKLQIRLWGKRWLAVVVITILPLLLIITGVIGGLIGFGIIGLFIGPVILAVTFTLLRAWISRGAPNESPSTL